MPRVARRSEMIKSIETIYSGHKFRSRLEARWAVFFDHVGLSWQYELEGFQMGGIKYLPDFWIEELDCFVEIKPSFPMGIDLEKVRAFAAEKKLILICGMPYASFVDGHEASKYCAYSCFHEGEFLRRNLFVVCRGCGKTIGLEGREFFLPSIYQFSEGGGYGICCTERLSFANHPLLLSAYKEAIQYRF